VLAEPNPKKGTKAKAPPDTETESILARFAGEAKVKKRQLVISYVEKEEREYPVPSTASIWVQTDDQVKAGQQLTDGSINPHDILRILGKEAVQQYLVDEVQKVYRSQGVNINDKHIEVVVHQMLTKVRIDSAGDTDLVPDELVDKFTYEDTNAKILAEGGEPATAHTVLLGITRASLSTDSWLAAASFQETTRILTEAAANGRVDKLVGLKENVIIGKLIPARYLKEEEVAELMPGEEDEALRLLANLTGLEEGEAVPTGMEQTVGEESVATPAGMEETAEEKAEATPAGMEETAEEKAEATSAGIEETAGEKAEVTPTVTEETVSKAVENPTDEDKNVETPDIDTSREVQEENEKESGEIDEKESD
jgi:hypothetical protein